MPKSGNLLLASLSPADRAALQPNLRKVDLKQKTVLFEAGEIIKAVYFPEGSVVSLVINLSSGETIEAAMVGCDGVVGASSALDGKLSLSRAIVQLAGPALTCDVDVLKGAALQSHALLSSLIRHEQTLYAQAQQSTACMATHLVEQRLARWMLRARDLSGSDTLDFTQELISDMLGVRRTSVTLEANKLQQAGMIKYARGHIRILNVPALEATACECYKVIKQHHDLLLGD